MTARNAEEGPLMGLQENYPRKAQHLVADALLNTSSRRVDCCCEAFRRQCGHLLVNPTRWDKVTPQTPELSPQQLERLMKHQRLVHGVQLYQHVESPHLLEKTPPSYAIEGGEFIMRVIRNSARDVVSPGRIMPAARELGTLGEISFAVLDQACQTVSQAQQRSGLDMNIHVSVNAPMEMLSDPQCADRIQQISKNTNIPLRNIVLELLQKDRFDPANSIPLLMLSKLTEEDGVSLAIDDFPMDGARGHIRLLREHGIPVNTVKFSGGHMSGYGRYDADKIKRLLREAHYELSVQPPQPSRQKAFVIEGFGSEGYPEAGYHPATLKTIREARREMHDEHDEDDEDAIRWLYEGVHTERVLTARDVMEDNLASASYPFGNGKPHYAKSAVISA